MASTIRTRLPYLHLALEPQMTNSEYLSSMPYETHFVNDVLSRGWVARHLKSLGQESLSICPECAVSDFKHDAGCSIAAEMEPHREGLEREGYMPQPTPAEVTPACPLRVDEKKPHLPR